MIPGRDVSRLVAPFGFLIVWGGSWPGMLSTTCTARGSQTTDSRRRTYSFKAQRETFHWHIAGWTCRVCLPIGRLPAGSMLFCNTRIIVRTRENASDTHL